MPDQRSVDVSQPPLWPAEWGRDRARTRLVAAALIFVVGALVSIPISVDALRTGDRRALGLAVLGGLVSTSFVAILAPLLPARRSTLPRRVATMRGPDGESGVVFPVIATWKPALIAWLVFGGVFVAAQGLVLIESVAESGRSVGANIAGFLGILVYLVLFVAILGSLVYLLRHLRGGGFIRLDAEGVTHSVVGAARLFRWDDIGFVTPCLVNEMHAVRLVLISESVFEPPAGRGVLGTLKSGHLERQLDLLPWTVAVDPALFLRTIRFYWLHPEQRPELRDAAAIDRMRRGDVAAD
ncbi:hypothetical protein [Nocardia shimofusensis]|uniref:hypothetical protein n=1 Tax=Nocardia shimofusensis TaxID=228596 RepID=UPI000833DA00|nr:hypothetical protein [Nocardia shimofusensis]